MMTTEEWNDKPTGAQAMTQAMTRQEAFQKAFMDTLKQIGLDEFKKCSFFWRNAGQTEFEKEPKELGEDT